MKKAISLHHEKELPTSLENSTASCMMTINMLKQRKNLTNMRPKTTWKIKVPMWNHRWKMIHPPSKLRLFLKKYLANRVEGLGFVFFYGFVCTVGGCLCMWCFGWLARCTYSWFDNVAINFNCCCTICAEPQQWQFEQQLFIIDLQRGLTWWQVPYLLKMSCSGDFLANSARQMDLNEMSLNAH